MVGSGISVGIARASDAAGIARCFEEAYGASYPNAWATDPRRLAERMEAGVSIFAVAVDEGAIVGTTALEPRPDGTGDLCHGAVLRSHRKLGLFSALHAPLVARGREMGMSALFGRCVTSHPFSQRAVAGIGARLCGLSLSVAPRSMQFLRIQEALAQREACFDSVLLVAPRSTSVTVHVPGALRAPVQHVYETLSIDCRFARSPLEVPRLRISTNIDEDLGIATLRFDTRGARPARAVDEIVDELEMRGIEAIFVELPLESPATFVTASALRERGFSFAAVLPGRASGGADALRLQRPRGEASAENVIADHPDAQALRSLVFADRASVSTVVNV